MALKFNLAREGVSAFQVGEEEPAIFLGTRWTKPAIWFELENVRATGVTLAARGMPFLSEPVEVRTGMAVEFEDPCGNRLGVIDYSKMPEHSRAKTRRVHDEAADEAVAELAEQRNSCGR